jgi:hypothetical protein
MTYNKKRKRPCQKVSERAAAFFKAEQLHKTKKLLPGTYGNQHKKGAVVPGHATKPYGEVEVSSSSSS